MNQARRKRRAASSLPAGTRSALSRLARADRKVREIEAERERREREEERAYLALLRREEKLGRSKALAVLRMAREFPRSPQGRAVLARLSQMKSVRHGRDEILVWTRGDEEINLVLGSGRLLWRRYNHCGFPPSVEWVARPGELIELVGLRGLPRLMNALSPRGIWECVERSIEMLRRRVQRLRRFRKH